MTFNDNSILDRTFNNKKCLDQKHYSADDYEIFMKIGNEAHRNFSMIAHRNCKALEIYGTKIGKTFGVQQYYRSSLEAYLTKSAQKLDLIDATDPDAKLDNFDFIRPMTYHGF